MAHMVVGTDAVVLHKTRKPHQSMIAEQTMAHSSKFEPKELRPENV